MKLDTVRIQQLIELGFEMNEDQQSYRHHDEDDGNWYVDFWELNVDECPPEEWIKRFEPIKRDILEGIPKRKKDRDLNDLWKSIERLNELISSEFIDDETKIVIEEFVANFNLNN